MKVQPVYGVATYVHSFCPKSVQHLVLFKHGPRHIDESSVLRFHHAHSIVMYKEPRTHVRFSPSQDTLQLAYF
jgi:hypothetical protein